MTAPETAAVMHALGEARFVGGAVRNALLGAGVSDIDIAVPMPPSEAAETGVAARTRAARKAADDRRMRGARGARLGAGR